MTEDVKDEFDKAFEEVAHQAERTPEEVKADEAAAAEAARKAAEAARTPEQIAADAKAAEEAAAAEAAATKAAEEAAAAAARANETPEAKAAREAAEKKASDDAAAAAAAKAAEEEAAAKAAKAAEEEAARKATEETPEAKAAREALEASIKPYEPTDAEKAALVQFEKDFPNEYQAMQARFKAQDKDINARVYAAVQEVLKQVAPRVAAVETTVAQNEVDRHFSALRAAHPDYDAVIAKVSDWIKTLPSYARVGAQAVYESGTTAEVAALVADYKKAAGVVAPPAEEPAAPVRKPAAKGAEDLTPVNTRRSTAAQKGAPDKNDLDGAWAELTEASGGK